MVKLLIDNFKDRIDINLADKNGDTFLHIACSYFNYVDRVKLIIDNFKDSIDVMLLDRFNTPGWYKYLLRIRRYDQDEFKTLFLPLLLSRDKSKDPQGLTPLHFAYLFRNQQSILDNSDNERIDRERGESILQSLLSIPELVELDGLQRDKFQTLPHQVTPVPARDYLIYNEDSDNEFLYENSEDEDLFNDGELFEDYFYEGIEDLSDEDYSNSDIYD